MLFARCLSNMSFNPCFNGSGTQSKSLPLHQQTASVSILVLMEVALKVKGESNEFYSNTVSILVLMEVALKAGTGHGEMMTENLFQSLF